jgi:hypothetical protein
LFLEAFNFLQEKGGVVGLCFRIFLKFLELFLHPRKMIFIGVENNGLIVLYDRCNFLIQIIEAALEFSVIVVDVIF